MNEQAFTSRMISFKDRLFRLARTMLQSHAEAEDVVQDVYVKLWGMREKLPQYNSVEALAVTVTKNLCIDRLRSYRHRNKNDSGLEEVALSAAKRHDPGHQLEVSEHVKQVRTIVALLPEQQRLILHLRDIEQYSYDEIEAMTQMSRNNIRVTLSRARHKVRDAFIKKYDHE